jgi:hypothetical protein
MFRFSTMAEAADALARVNADYERHCRAAREIAEACFDAKQVVAAMLNAVGPPAPSPSPSGRGQG